MLLCYEEATEKEESQKAMVGEIKSIENNETWQMVDLPKGKNAIGLKWVFKTKFVVYVSLRKHKAHFIVKVMHNNIALISKKHFFR